MAEARCATCGGSKRYIEKPKSFLGRLWRWHANWCPGWNGYMKSLPEAERKQIAEKINQKKYL